MIRAVLAVAMALAAAPLAGTPDGPGGRAALHALQPAQVFPRALPDTVAERIVAFYNSPSTTRLEGDAHISAGTTVRGGVALLAGNLTIDGVVEGDVVVINGHLVIRGDARVAGDVTVTGGQVRVEQPAVVTGRVNTWPAPLSYRYTDGGIAYVADAETGIAASRDFDFGRTDLFVASYGAYNRAEGMPLAIGPRVRFAGEYPITVRAFAILRSATTSEVASDFDLQRFGYDLAIEQVVLPDAGASIGARLHSRVDPIESWQLSDRESALSTFLLHQDMRDHYERRGWSVHARLQPDGSPLGLQLDYLDERHASVPAADPFALLYRHRDWRPEPAIAEGTIRTITAHATYDTRNEVHDPSAGWLVRAGLEQAVGGAFDDASVPTDFRTASLDLRRYARLSPYARLSLRVFAAGSLDGRALPAQRQHALGGEGSLPGYSLFEFDCGARTSTVELRGRLFQPYYGCDQAALIQIEYQAGFPFARRITHALGLAGTTGQLVRWVAFFDAGRAWTEPDARGDRAGGRDDFSADGGLGVRAGPLGLYWAVPFSGGKDGVNFFIRLGPRI